MALKCNFGFASVSKFPCWEVFAVTSAADRPFFVGECHGVLSAFSWQQIAHHLHRLLSAPSIPIGMVVQLSSVMIPWSFGDPSLNSWLPLPYHFDVRVIYQFSTRQVKPNIVIDPVSSSWLVFDVPLGPWTFCKQITLPLSLHKLINPGGGRFCPSDFQSAGGDLPSFMTWQRTLCRGYPIRPIKFDWS